MSVRFLHCGDLHLGSQLTTGAGEATAVGDVLESAVYTAVERLFDVALEEDVDFVVVAGDLYDADARSVRANAFLAEQFERLADAGIPAYVCYGNHDPVGTATTYVDLPETVHEFDHEAPEEFLYPGPDDPEARIWGQSYRDRHESRSMYRRFTPADDRVPNVGVLHTGLDPDGRRYVPVSRGDLAGKDAIGYWALGHLHSPQVVDEAGAIAYPGVPQGRDVTETGPGGGLLVELETSGPTRLEFVPTSPVVWRTVDVDVGADTIETVPDIRRAVERAAEDLSVTTDRFEGPVTRRDHAWGVDGYVCRWRLTGNGPAHETLARDEDSLVELTRRLRDRLPTRAPFVWTEAVRDRTGPPVPSVDDLKGSDRVVDEFLALADEVSQEEPDEDLVEAVGVAWERVDDHEETEPDSLPLTDDRFDDLLERATRQVFEELARRRAE